MADSLLTNFSRSLSSPHRPFQHLHSRRRQYLLFNMLSSSTSSSIGNLPIYQLSQKAADLAATACSGVERDYSSSIFDSELDESPSSIELIPITSEEQFDQIIAEAQKHEEPIVVLWMANWCRKCIYLKPKLEKTAADYHPRIRFYCVDVNAVPHKLVTRAGVTKMPTIQLWSVSRKQAEVIGGHKAWRVVDDVRRMIESDD